MGAHGVCKQCVLNFFRRRIEDGRVEDLVCLIGESSGKCDLIGEVEGPARATDAEVERAVATMPELFEKYQRFKAERADAHLRECPGCETLCKPELLESGQPKAEVICSNCDAAFCYYHSWAHKEDGNCAAYEARLVRESQANASAFGLKNCPGCQFPTDKNGGCNHMTCQKCHCDWCWICGQLIPDGSLGVFAHYDPENPESRCDQFTEEGDHLDHEELRRRRTTS